MWKISDSRDSWATDTGLAGFCSRVGSDTIDFRLWFRFSAESPSLLSVAHTVSAECDMSLSAYFRLRPKVEFPLIGRPLVSLAPIVRCGRPQGGGGGVGPMRTKANKGGGRVIFGWYFADVLYGWPLTWLWCHGFRIHEKFVIYCQDAKAAILERLCDQFLHCLAFESMEQTHVSIIIISHNRYLLFLNTTIMSKIVINAILTPAFNMLLTH